MIMVLSFFDFLTVFTSHPILIIRLVLSLNGTNDTLVRAMVQHFPNVFVNLLVDSRLLFGYVFSSDFLIALNFAENTTSENARTALF